MKILNLMNKICNEVAENKAKILDDFFKAYLASRWDDYFSKQAKVDLRRIELVEERKPNGLGAYYSFRLKRGKIKQKKGLTT